MVFNPLLAAGLSAAGVVGSWKIWQYLKGESHKADLVNPLDPAKELVTGRVYALVFTVNDKIGTRSVDVARANLKNVFEQSGFTVLDTPSPRDGDEIKKFGAGLPSVWTLMGRWNKTEKYVTSLADFIPMVVPYAAPMV